MMKLMRIPFDQQMVAQTSSGSLRLAIAVDLEYLTALLQWHHDRYVRDRRHGQRRLAALTSAAGLGRQIAVRNPSYRWPGARGGCRSA
jgi:hypothetical protein